MTDGTADVSRRAFMRTAAGATTAAAATGTVVAQESEESGGESGPPDFGSWFASTDNFSETQDSTGQDEVTVQVGTQANGGAFGFGPAAVHVDNGATVKFEWTGDGGTHNVVSDGDGPLNSGSAVDTTGVQYEHTFEEDGIYKYYCVPHEGLGMKGAIVVGSDYPTADTGGGGGSAAQPALPESVKSLGVATSVVMTATLGLAYVFMKYGGDYDTPE